MGKTWYWLALASLLAACGETQEPPVGLVVDRDAIRDQELERLAVEDAPMTLDPSMPAAPPGAAVVPEDEIVELAVRTSKLAKQLVTDRLEAPFERAEPLVDLVRLDSSDRGAIEELLLGRADAAVVATTLSEKDRAQGLCSRTLGYHVVVMIVHTANPVRSLTSAQVRRVLRGELASWNKVAYMRGDIQLALGPKDELQQRAQTLLIPGDHFDKKAKRLASTSAVIERVATDKFAIGVCSLAEVEGRKDVRVVAIDGVAPSVANLKGSRYRAGVPIELAYRCYGQTSATLLVDFVTNPQSPVRWRDRLSTK